MSLAPTYHVGRYLKQSSKVIRLHLKGCTNRPFYHIVVTEIRRNQHHPIIEQVGTYDPMPNQNNEKLVSLNYERIRSWIGKGAHVSSPVGELLGLAGFFPIHPRSYMTAWRNRAQIEKETEEKTKTNVSIES